MPGFTTHYLFGVQNLKQLKRSAECGRLLESIQKYKTVFQFGLQGPDIFFYHPASQVRRVNPGSAVHTRWTGDFLKCLIKAPDLFVRREDQHAARSYAAGFIGHYMLDAQMHPYVYGITGTGEELKKKGYGDHIALETDIDAGLLMRYAKRLPSEFAYGKTIAFDAKTRAAVASALSYAYHVVFPELSLSRRFLAGAVRSMQIGTMLTYNPHNYKRQVLEAAERLVCGHPVISPVIPSDQKQTAEDPLNLQHRQWRHPWHPQKYFTSSVPQLIKKASGKYQNALKQLDHLYGLDSGDDEYDECLEVLYQFLGQKSFHTGQEWMLGE